MTRCEACGVEISTEAARFCVECGAPLSASCPSCGLAVTAGQRFCAGCGANLLPPALATEPRSEQVAERRVCSVLFVDLVGFTTLAEGRDPEEVRELLTRYFDRARTVIGRYGGTVEKFIGDAVMAVWGAPTATEGDAEHAVRAGLDVVSAVAVLGEEAGVPGLAARAGVVTGEVAITLGAVGQGMVAGDAVNTAARVQASAPAGAVLVDDMTHRLAVSAIVFEDAGEHTLKGRSAPEQLWSASRVVSGFAGSQRPDGLEAPLCGRDAELRTLKELFHSTADRRLPRLVVVTGAAGAGKSRLGWEFEKYVDGLADTVLWHRGRCLSYGDGVAFWALAEIVRQRLGIAEEDPPEVAAVKLTEGLTRQIGDPDERAYVAPRIGRLLGVRTESDRGASFGREELFAGWRVFFERLAEVAPVILLIEDAQQADTGILDFLEHLVDWVRDLAIFVVLFTRPELAQLRPGFGEGRNRTALFLDPLDGASMDELVDALVPGMAGAARRAIVAQAQGIPLFAVETVRSLIDRDVVVPQGGVYRLVGEVGALAVPDSLHALLAARLDALDPDVRTLVADAAVLGTTFPAEALLAVAGAPEDAVREGLAVLVRRDVLEVSADPLSPQRGTYRFSQDMLRQVAYETLSRRDRKARHLAVAAHLRATFANDGEEVTDVVAHHYLDAADAIADDPDVEEIRAEAHHALVRAAERANRAGAPERAAASWATAASLLDDPDAAASLWERAAEAAIVSGDPDNSAAHAGAAAELHDRTGDARGAARARTIAGRAAMRAGRHDQARELYEAALTVLRPQPDVDTVRALRSLAGLELFDGDVEACDRVSAEALALGQDLDVDAALLGDLLTTRGGAHSIANRSADAIAYYREGARLTERAGDHGAAGRALVNLADELGSVDPAGAADAARAAVGHAGRSGDRHMLGVAIANLAIALVDQGDWDQAVTVLAQDADVSPENHDLILSGWLAALRGEDATAAAAAEAIAPHRGTQSRQTQAWFALLDATTADAAGRRVAGLGHARRVVALADTLGVRHETIRWGWPLATRLARDLDDAAALDELLAVLDAHPAGHLPPALRAARALARAWRAADPESAYAEAVASLRRAANPYLLANGLIDRAADLQSAEGLDEAMALARQLGCPALRDRVDGARAGLALPA